MKPSKIKPNTELVWTSGLEAGKIVLFVKRVPGENGRPAVNYLQTEELNRTDGKRYTFLMTMTDYQLSRECRLPLRDKR